MGAPQEPDSAIRIRNIMEHLLAFKDGFLRLPVVTVVTGAEAGIEGIRRVAGGEMSLEKLTLKHPLE
ncbi:hypothetical protein FNYG_12803 [Fusarium nygamai]|uniref:Uncharacterized protein n=1 Tax=Gibberella nygamai TaxID=42673 RepID=A0A2K0VUZ2_GIBNY|nr:hypothetical protein FNYG_12803 [Fusarium nygamai]